MHRVFAILFLSLVASAADAQVPDVALPGAEVCPIDLPIAAPNRGWSPVERWTWNEICLGRKPNLAHYSPLPGESSDGLPCNPATLAYRRGAHRTLRADFLTVILTQDRWTRAPLKRQVRISCARIDGMLDLENATVEPAFHLENSHIPEFVDLEGARFERNLSFRGTQFDDKLNADRLSVGGDFLMSGAAFKAVDLGGARILGTLNASSSEFGGVVNARSLRVDGSVEIGLSGFASTVRLSNSVIGGRLNATYAQFRSELELGSARIENDLFLRGNAKFANVNLTGAVVGAHIQLTGATFSGTVNLSRATAGELILFRPQKPNDYLKADHENPVWLPGSSLILRNVTVDTMQAQLQSWHLNGCGNVRCTWIPADLNGLVYRRLEGFRAAGQNTLLDATARDLAGWLKGVATAYAGGREFLTYDPHPFEQLAAALDLAGMQSKARSVRFAKYVYRDEVQPVGWYRQYLLHPLARVSIGYGVYPFWALAWWVALVLIGFAVSHASQNAVIRTRRRKFWYSLERALPLIELSQTHRKIRHRNRWLDSYFNLHTVGGFVLATLLIGALSFLPG